MNMKEKLLTFPLKKPINLQVMRIDQCFSGIFPTVSPSQSMGLRHTVYYFSCCNLLLLKLQQNFKLFRCATESRTSTVIK